MPRHENSRTTIEDIARSYERFDKAELIDMLSYLTKQYVLDGTMPFNLPGERDGKLGDVGGQQEELTFSKLIDQLKRRLPNLKELGYFHVDNDRVVLRVDNQKITFGERVTSEFVAATAPVKPPPGPKPAGAPRPEAERRKAAEPSLTEAQQEALNDIKTRFKSLELD
ncbi:MAG: hypothetical protein D6776_08255 [Planctomycetota bacterium]|nr:MAG: hypothetical protein D6776_08255 [Planctomycetota bacterium]